MEVQDENEDGGGGGGGGDQGHNYNELRLAISTRPSADTQVSRPSIANQSRSGLGTAGKSGQNGLG